LNQQARYKKNGLNRQRKPGGGRKGALSTPELKLFFILFYLKNYPTFDVLGCLFDLSPAKAQENISKLMPLLKQAEKRLRVLPHRHFKPASNNQQDNENIEKIIIDATERPHRRPRAIAFKFGTSLSIFIQFFHFSTQDMGKVVDVSSGLESLVFDT
jgi:hypothetical protein